MCKPLKNYVFATVILGNSFKVFLVVQLMNKLANFRCLQHRSFLILHGWQNMMDFIEGFLWITLSFSIFLLPIISQGLFDRRLVSIHGSWHIYVFTNSPARVGCDTRSVFKRSSTTLNSEFSFSKTGCYGKVKEPFYLSVPEGRIIGFVPFPMVLTQWKM